MKRVIIIISLFVTSAFVVHAQDRCDTLKWKTMHTNYVKQEGGSYVAMGRLNNTVINVDTLPRIHYAAKIVNISNDTFAANDQITIMGRTELHTDTGLFGGYNWQSFWSYFDKDCMPNDTLIKMYGIGVDFLSVINQLKELDNVELEEITHWKFIMGVTKTSKDGFYSDSVIMAGMDTSIFYVVRGGVGVQEIEKNPSIVSVYPNPAKTYFTVTNTENAEIQLFNVLGQKVFQTIGTQENTVVNTASLPQGLYVLKVVKDNVSTVHKVQIVR